MEKAILMSKSAEETKTDERFEKLKEALYGNGTDFIDDFLGYEFDYDLPKKELDKAMYEVYKQMPNEELEEFFREYDI